MANTPAGQLIAFQGEPGAYSHLACIEAKPDMILTVEAVRLDGASEEPIYDASFSDTDEERLDALKAEFGQ